MDYFFNAYLPHQTKISRELWSVDDKMLPTLMRHGTFSPFSRKIRKWGSMLEKKSVCQPWHLVAWLGLALLFLLYGSDGSKHAVLTTTWYNTKMHNEVLPTNWRLGATAPFWWRKKLVVGEMEGGRGARGRGDRIHWIELDIFVRTRITECFFTVPEPSNSLAHCEQGSVDHPVSKWLLAR